MFVRSVAMLLKLPARIEKYHLKKCLANHNTHQVNKVDTLNENQQKELIWSSEERQGPQEYYPTHIRLKVLKLTPSSLFIVLII